MSATITEPVRSTADAEEPYRCSHCKAEKPDAAGLILAETAELEAEEFGFCTLACLVLFVRTRYMEAGA